MNIGSKLTMMSQCYWADSFDLPEFAGAVMLCIQCLTVVIRLVREIFEFGLAPYGLIWQKSIREKRYG